jgi:hypothetical protein
MYMGSILNGICHELTKSGHSVNAFLRKPAVGLERLDGFWPRLEVFLTKCMAHDANFDRPYDLWSLIGVWR